MAEKNTQTLDNLNQNNLWDKKLSREEISYIQSKDQLWFKDIGDKLFDDIVSTNEKLLKDSTSLKAFIDDIILQPETLRQIAQKAWISLGKVEKMFSEWNQNLDNKTNKYYIVVNLLLYWCTKNIFPEVKWNLIDNINKPAFTAATAKALHKFQKMWENIQWRSKADCLLWPKTLQQMLSYLWVQTVNKNVDTETFARSNMSAKETYEWNAEQKKQMDIIINDPALTPEQKASFLAKVANKTVDVWSDKLNKKYGAVSYMCQLIANNLMVWTTPEQQESIVAAVLPYEKLIKKYWNEKSAVEFGVDPKLVPKTNDFVKDIKDMAKSVESKYQSNTIMAQTALQICSAWISYYQQDNPKWRKKNQASIEQWKKELESLLTHKTTGDIRQSIASAMDKIFFDTATKIDFSTVVTDKVIVWWIDIAGSFTSYANLQKRAFKWVKNIFLADKKRTENESKNAINEAFTAFRYIDKEMDGDFDIGIGEKFRMWTWKTSEGIRSTVENMWMSWLALDVKNAPQEFTNEQNAIKNWVQNIKNALETDPNGSVAQKVDKLLTAIAANDNTTIKALIKDAELFGMDVSDKSIGEITKRMQEISKQNEKNKEAVFNDMKKNYNKVYEQMKWTQLWLREQWRGDEADMIDWNKQVYEALINGWVVTNPPEWLEQFAWKTLDNIATEEIRKMERMQLTWVLEVWLMRWLMMKYEDMLKTLAEKTWLSTDENLIKMYADIDGFDGSWKDETCNMVWSIAAEILITIIVCVLTAGIWWIVVNSILKWAQWIFKAVRWWKAANTIARFWQLGNTSLKVIRTATWVSKTVKTTQTAAKVLYRSTALLAEAPAFNTVSKMIHNGIEWNPLLEWVLWWYTDANWVYHKSTLNPIAKENIQTAAFLGVMHGFSVVRWWVVSINFWKAWEIFAKSPQFVKSLSSVAGEFTTMMASEQVMNLTFGREIPDPNDPTKTIIERWIHIPEKKDVMQMVWMILGMRVSKKFNLWPKIEARLKTGEFTVLKIEKNDVVIADKSWNKMKLFADQAKVKDAIEMKKANAEQRKIDKEANNGKQSQAQKNIDMVVRMKTRNAPNKTGTRLWKEYKVSKNSSKDIAKATVLEKNPLLEIKSNMKAAMDYIWLTKSNVVTIEGKKHMFLGVKEWKALFVEKWVAWALPKAFTTVESMKDINFEPGSKETNSWRIAKFDELINAKEVIVVEPQNSIVENTSQGNAKNNIESQFNNFDKSPSQKKLDSFNKWYEKQNSFELEVLQAQELMRWVDQKLLSQAMITLMNAKDISQLSSNDIKRVQKEIGIQPKNADGIRWPKSQAKLEALLLKSGSKRNIEKNSWLVSKSNEIANNNPVLEVEINKKVDEQIQSKDPFDNAAKSIVDNMFAKNPSALENWVASKTKRFLEFTDGSISNLKNHLLWYKAAIADYTRAIYVKVLNYKNSGAKDPQVEKNIAEDMAKVQVAINTVELIEKKPSTPRKERIKNFANNVAMNFLWKDPVMERYYKIEAKHNIEFDKKQYQKLYDEKVAEGDVESAKQLKELIQDLEEMWQYVDKFWSSWVDKWNNEYSQKLEVQTKWDKTSIVSKEIPATSNEVQPIAIEHDFQRGSLMLKNQVVWIDMWKGQEYIINAGEQVFTLKRNWDNYLIVQESILKVDGSWNIIAWAKGIRPWEKIVIGKDSNPNNRFSFANDMFIGKEHFEITVDNNGNIKLRDLNTHNATRVELSRAKAVDVVNRSNKMDEVLVQSIDFTSWPKKLFESNNVSETITYADGILNWLRGRWSLYDWDISNSQISIDRVKYHGTYHGRPIVEIKMPNGNSEYFYKSTWWAKKVWAGVDWTTNGMWQPFWWFADVMILDKWIPSPVKWWFIKDSDYKNYYKSQTFKNIAENLDGLLMKQMKIESVTDLDAKVNFQNQNSPIDTYSIK